MCGATPNVLPRETRDMTLKRANLIGRLPELPLAILSLHCACQ